MRAPPISDWAGVGLSLSLSWAGLGWAELHPRPEASYTDLGWAGLIVIVIVGWAGLSCTHGRRRTRRIWAGLGLSLLVSRAGLGWAELHPRPEACPTDLGWAGLSCTHAMGKVWKRTQARSPRLRQKRKALMCPHMCLGGTSVLHSCPCEWKHHVRHYNPMNQLKKRDMRNN